MSDGYKDLIEAMAAAKGLPKGSPETAVVSEKSRQEGLENYKRHHKEFKELLKLNSNEKLLLSFCTALQVLRWTIVGLTQQPLGNPKTPEEIKIQKEESGRLKRHDLKNEKLEEVKNYDNIKREGSKYRSATEIISQCVPYDVTNGKSIGLDGGFHRQNTLGHDPILGWIFGVANIITDTVTTRNFTTYKAIQTATKYGKFQLGTPPTPVFTPNIFYWVFESLMEDKFRLPAALYAQSVHLRSDIKDPLGLPFPILGTILNKISFVKTEDGWKRFSELYKNGYDYLKASQKLQIDLKSQSISGGVAVLVNLTIAFLHWILYDNKQDKKYYFAKTLKIIEYSNVIATSSNLVTSVIAPQMFDFAGAMNTAMVYVGTQLKISNLEGEYFGRRLLKDFNQVL